MLPALLLLLSPLVVARPTPKAAADPLDPSLATTVNFQGDSFVNHGLVAFGEFPADELDQFGDTIGGIGSAAALQRGSWKRRWDGSYEAVILAQPDRGHNEDGAATVDYPARHHRFHLSLSPYYDASNQTLDDGADSLELEYIDSVKYKERGGKETTGLDPLFVRKADGHWPDLPVSDRDRISLDSEGIAVDPRDGTYWVSDEYGPLIYHVARDGTILSAVSPPKSLLPLRDGNLNFTATTEGDSGRTSNQGFEGLTASHDGNALFAILQSATLQDSAKPETADANTRLVRFDISDAHDVKITGHWVVQLPVSDKNKTRATSDLLFLDDHTFLTLSRDGDGNGDSDQESSKKGADLIDISAATNLLDTQYSDSPDSLAPNGTLLPSITPAAYQQFVDYLDPVNLARFGLHNGEPLDDGLISAKWESLILAPALDDKNPDDYILITISDNDYITTNGHSIGQPYNDSYGRDVKIQIMAFRLTLPNVDGKKLKQYLGI